MTCTKLKAQMQGRGRGHMSSKLARPCEGGAGGSLPGMVILPTVLHSGSPRGDSRHKDSILAELETVINH